jgi:hypothetical protein
MQGTIRKKEEELTGAIWDCLPVTEKSKDEINFAGLGEEVRTCSRVSFSLKIGPSFPITQDENPCLTRAIETSIPPKGLL